MRVEYNGIHKRIGFIIQHIGGYDVEYHINKISEELNIERNIIQYIFDNSPRSRVLSYIDLLRRGYSTDRVVDLMKRDNDKDISKLHLLEFYASLFSSSLSRRTKQLSNNK